MKFTTKALSVPYPAVLSPIYYEIRDATEEWVSSCCLLDDTEKRSAFFASEFSLFVCLVYHQLKDVRVMKAFCDFMSFFFLFDDPCEQFGEDLAALEAFVAPVLAVIAGGEPSDKYSMAFQDFSERLELSPYLQRRYLAAYRDYILGILATARDQFRVRLEDRELEDYVQYRRSSIGARPCLVLLEKALGIEVPEEIINSGPMVECVNAVIDHVWLSNDIVSFNKEIAHGEHRGIIEYLRLRDRCSYQQAVDQAIAMANEKIQAFEESRGGLLAGAWAGRQDIRSYVEGLEYWLSGNLLWERLSYRYKRYNC
jgi:alpha-muurolene/germacrene-A/gamma-muurolene synthase